MWKIKLYLQNGLTHILNDVRSGRPGWAECSPGGITKLEFSFLGTINGKQIPLMIVLSGMEKYNFFVEAIQGVGTNVINIKGIWFLGKKFNDDKIEGFVIGDSIRKINSFEGKEYNGFGTVGWKEGISQEKSFAMITRL